MTGHDARSAQDDRYSNPLGSKFVLWVLSIAAIFAIGFVVGSQWALQSNKVPDLTEQEVTAKIEDCSDLVTSKLSYDGFVRYEQGNIPFINRKAFAMGYRAEIQAGIDLSQAQVSVEGKDIKVKLPPSAIQSIKIDPASLTFYDNEYSLFAWDNKEDTVSALNTAQSDVETKMNRTELLERADMQARKAIEDMLKGLTYGREGYNVDVSVVPRPEP